VDARSLLALCVLGAPVGYPATRYDPLPQPDFVQRSWDLSRQPDPAWRFGLESFGFASASTKDPSWAPPEARSFSASDRERIGRFLLEHRDVFGIDKGEKPVLLVDDAAPASPQAGDRGPGWQRLRWAQSFGGRPFFTFKGQAGQGSEFLNAYEAPIEVTRNPHPGFPLLSIKNHHWPHAQLPSKPALSESSVRDRFVGEKQMVIPGGRMACDPTPQHPNACRDLPVIPDRIIKWSVRSEDVKATLAAHLVPQGTALELHLAYVVEVQNEHGGGQGPGLHVLDAMTGEELPLR
jgi:hypothetical protein